MSNQQNIVALIKAISGQANVLTIPRIYVDLTNSHRAALFLSQCVYWSDKTKDPEGWFYKTFPEWREELGLPRGAVETAVKATREWVETKVMRVGKHPKTHYRVNLDALESSISNLLESSTLITCWNPALSNLLENSRLSIHRLHTETTVARKREKQTDPRSQHPAIQAYRLLTHRYPQKVNYDRIINLLGETPDAEKLQIAFENWCGRGYNPANLSWLDWYQNGVPANGGGHGRNGQKDSLDVVYDYMAEKGMLTDG